MHLLYAVIHFFYWKKCFQLLEDSVEERMEKSLAESDKIEAESKEADAEDNKARDHIFLH